MLHTSSHGKKNWRQRTEKWQREWINGEIGIHGETTRRLLIEATREISSVFRHQNKHFFTLLTYVLSFLPFHNHTCTYYLHALCSFLLHSTLLHICNLRNGFHLNGFVLSPFGSARTLAVQDQLSQQVRLQQQQNPPTLVLPSPESLALLLFCHSGSR